MVRPSITPATRAVSLERHSPTWFGGHHQALLTPSEACDLLHTTYLEVRTADLFDRLRQEQEDCLYRPDHWAFSAVRGVCACTSSKEARHQPNNARWIDDLVPFLQEHHLPLLHPQEDQEDMGVLLTRRPHILAMLAFERAACEAGLSHEADFYFRSTMACLHRFSRATSTTSSLAETIRRGQMPENARVNFINRTRSLN